MNLMSNNNIFYIIGIIILYCESCVVCSVSSLCVYCLRVITLVYAKKKQGGKKPKLSTKNNKGEGVDKHYGKMHSVFF